MKKSFLLLGLSLTLLLVACGKKQLETPPLEESTTIIEETSKFATVYEGKQFPHYLNTYVEESKPHGLFGVGETFETLSTDGNYVYNEKQQNINKIDVAKINKALGEEITPAGIIGNRVIVQRPAGLITGLINVEIKMVDEEPVVYIADGIISKIDSIDDDTYLTLAKDIPAARDYHVYRIKKDGSITDFGSVGTMKASEIKPTIQTIQVKDKIYITGVSEFYEVTGDKAVTLGFGFNNSESFIASNIVSDGINIYGIKGFYVDDAFGHKLVTWDSNWNVIKEQTLSLVDDKEISYVYMYDTIHIKNSILYLIGSQQIRSDTPNGSMIYYTAEINLKDSNIIERDITDMIDDNHYNIII